MESLDLVKTVNQRETIVQSLLLSTLVIYTSAMTFLIHASRSNDNRRGIHQVQYSVSMSIVMSETIKLIFCLLAEGRSFYKEVRQGYSQIKVEEDDTNYQDSPTSSPSLSDSTLFGSPIDEKTIWSSTSTKGYERDNSRICMLGVSEMKAVAQHLYENALKPPSLLYSVPAILYVAQSMTQLLALSFLTPVLFQCVTQTKILSAAILSRMFLRSNLTRLKYFLLIILVFGVMIVAKNTNTSSNKNAIVQKNTIRILSTDPKIDLKMVGIVLSILGGAFGSGAGLVMEVILKNKGSGTIWSRNAHLAIFSIFFTSIVVIFESARSGSWHVFQGFGFLAWLVVIIRALGGILISLVLKYTNTILKGVATGLAMTLSIILEIYLFQKPCSLMLVFGSILVILSSLGYVFQSLIVGPNEKQENK